MRIKTVGSWCFQAVIRLLQKLQCPIYKRSISPNGANLWFALTTTFLACFWLQLCSIVTSAAWCEGCESHKVRCTDSNDVLTVHDFSFFQTIFSTTYSRLGTTFYAFTFIEFCDNLYPLLVNAQCSWCGVVWWCCWCNCSFVYFYQSGTASKSKSWVIWNHFLGLDIGRITPRALNISGK